jgi:lysophospholipase L1-like esterase
MNQPRTPAATAQQFAMNIPLLGRPWRPISAWNDLRRYLPPALPALLLALLLVLALVAMLGQKRAGVGQLGPPPAAGAWERWYWGGFGGKKIIGASLRMMTTGSGDVYFRLEHVIAARPDMLIIRGPLINDVRMGETATAQAIAMLAATLDKITAALPQTAVLLLSENSLLTTDEGGYGFVRPNTAAQKYTRIMHRSVMAMAGRYPQVRVFDLMAVEYGLRSRASSPLMHDQLHPNAAGQRREADLVAQIIGRRQR